MDREDSGEESPEDPADGISGNEYPRSLGGVLGCQVVVGSCERERGDRCERDACGKSGDEEHGEGGGEDAEGVECGAGDEGGGEGASPAEAGVGVDPGDDAGGEAEGSCGDDGCGVAWGDVEVVGDVWERCLGCVDLREGDESGGEECGEEVTVGTGWVGIGGGVVRAGWWIVDAGVGFGGCGHGVWAGWGVW